MEWVTQKNGLFWRDSLPGDNSSEDQHASLPIIGIAVVDILDLKHTLTILALPFTYSIHISVILHCRLYRKVMTTHAMISQLLELIMPTCGVNYPAGSSISFNSQINKFSNNALFILLQENYVLYFSIIAIGPMN
ncbi:LOW QUALITY PROTEIN: hypothetical protein HID58_075519 [Brassica napus]|uniref:Uncharacterized protein n=1 Tax=Brassica napus TaxID=3708 RepID=A0ABQ7YLI9_BRANA|nr:LOW QUALITY PROTEIN: hypothetical protein HID58_075519 [Brassica napus]